MVVTDSPVLDTSDSGLLGFDSTGTVWFIFCVCCWPDYRCLPGNLVRYKLPRSYFDSFYCFKLAKTTKTVSHWSTGRFIILLIIAFYLQIIYLLRSATGEVIPPLLYLLPAVSSAVVWPWLMSGLRFIKGYFRVL